MAYQPRIDKSGIYNNVNWYSSSLNPFYPHAQLPNCTCYAWGRWKELGYPTESLSIGNGDAFQWFPYTQARGILICNQTPALGAIACWIRPDGARGHVAIVEAINADGTILISESGYQRPLTDPVYNMSKYFWTEILTPLNNYSVYGYNLQGFIHPPTAQTLDWIHVETDQNPNFTQADRENNARLIYSVLLTYGWTLEAIAAALGNMQSEGLLNPGQCEFGRGLPAYDSNTGIPTSIYYPPPSGAGYGLGLCGWTGYAGQINYPNAVLYYCYTNNVPWYSGQAQCKVLDLADDPTFRKLGTNDICYGWIPSSSFGNESFADFKRNASNRSVADLASEFLYCFEIPADPSATEATRRAQAVAWYNYLINAGPVDPPYDPGVPTDPIRKMPVWQMIRYH